MLISQTLIDEYIKQWKGAGVRELKTRLKNIPKRQTRDAVAERKAIEALLS